MTLASFQRSSLPSLRTVASDHELLAELAIWTRVMDGPPREAQSSSSWPAGRPHSRLAELPRLFRSH